jgi:hypothetical protein
LLLGVKVNRKVGRQAFPEVGLEVEVGVGCTQLEVGRKAFPEVSLKVEVEVGCALPICLDSEGSVLRVRVKVM